MGEIAKVSEAPRAIAVRGIDDSSTLKTALGIVESIEKGFSITTKEDREQANDAARFLKRGLTVLAEGLTDAFRPLKEIERLTRAHYAAKYGDRLEATVKRVNNEREKWDRQEAHRIREEQIRAQREEEERKRTAGTEDALPPPEAPAEHVEQTTRGAIATSTQIRKAKAVELVDPHAAAEKWGAEVVTLNATLATERFAARVKLGEVELPPDGEAGVVVGGVRFVTVLTYSDRARGGR